MTSCLAELSTNSGRSPLPFRPAEQRPLEVTQEPIQVDNYRLSAQERSRRLTQGLCLYCGERGHLRSTCPTRPPCLGVSAITTEIPNIKPLTIEILLIRPKCSLPVIALLDSGSTGNFISGSLCRQLHLSTTATPQQYQIQSVNGKPVSRRYVNRWSVPIQLRVGILHVENTRLLVLEGSTVDIILGRPWFLQHEPTISWRTGEVLKWGSSCFDQCFPDVPRPIFSPPAKLELNTTSIASPPRKTIN